MDIAHVRELSYQARMLTFRHPNANREAPALYFYIDDVIHVSAGNLSGHTTVWAGDQEVLSARPEFFLPDWEHLLVYVPGEWEAHLEALVAKAAV